MPKKERDWYIRLPAELYDELRDVAELEDRSISSAARNAIRDGLQHRLEAGAVK
jgi:predicted transcriptional regulator